MAFVIEDAFLPATLSFGLMTDDEFVALCQQHPDLSLESTAEGEIVVMPPTFSEGGEINAEVSGQLYLWAKRDGRGKTYDSSAGFVLPNGARRSPDASWILKSRKAQLNRDSRRKFWRICPDFVIEIKSPTDRLRQLQAKMHEYIDNGAHLGWLIDPEQRSVAIYRPNRDPQTVVESDSIAGESPVEGFVLDLIPVWESLD